MGYLANFIVYTLAMVGIIVLALLVFKNATSISNNQKSKYLKVIDSMQLSPKKILYVVSTGRENFLIAGDVDKTTLISKLETSSTNTENIPTQNSLKIKTEPETTLSASSSFKQTMKHLAKPSYMDKSNVGIKSSLLSQKTETHSVMKSLAERIAK